MTRRADLLAQEHAIVQTDENVAYAPKISRTFGEVNWSEMSVEDVFRRHRAIAYKVPLETTFRGKRIKLLSFVDPINDPGRHTVPVENAEPGTLHAVKKSPILYVKCSDGWIGCTAVKVDQKRDLDIKNFYNGYMPKSGKDRFGA
ncbi:hypothetical protein HDV00_005387 [Rhizophlyctis rosea]|nr:hypothetical protein HDV00_005387 [Rhizophlyctis rosea]